MGNELDRQFLRTLPQDDEYEDESEDEFGDERSDDDCDDEDSGEWVSESDEEEPEWGAKGFSTTGRQRSYHGTDTLVGGMSGDERRA